MTVTIWRELVEILGEPFPCKSLPESLRQTIEYVGDSGFIASMPQLLREFPHSRWYTAFSEEDVLIDKTGRFERKGRPVVITSHGKIILGTPERLEQAVKNLTGTYAGKLTPEEATGLLEGQIRGEPTNIWHYEDFVKQDSLPENYSVVRPLSLAQQTKSGRHDVNDLCDKEGKVTDSQVIVYAGGVKAAQRVIERAKEKLNSKLGVWHSFNENGFDASTQPQGCLLFLGYCYDLDGGGGPDYYDGGCFVGVRRASAPIGRDAKISVSDRAPLTKEADKDLVPLRDVYRAVKKLVDKPLHSKLEQILRNLSSK